MEFDMNRNDFIENLKVQVNEQSITVFPTDEEILQNMDKTDRLFVFDIEDIDKKIKIEKLTKMRRTTIFIL